MSKSVMHYRNLDKQGLLIELKIKPGDKAYKIFPVRNGGFAHKSIFPREILPIEVNEFRIVPKTISYGNGNKTILVFKYECKYYEDRSILETITVTEEDFGKTVFLTREEAELNL